MLSVLGESERFPAPCVLLLGGFDGLHLGHRTLLERAKRSGLPVGITSVFGGKGKALFTPEEREYVFSQNGVRFVIEIPLTEKWKNTSAEDFLRGVFGRIEPREIVCGADFRFGRNAEGNAELLKRLAPCPVTVLEAVKYLSEESGRMRKYSSSACKELLKRGELSRLDRCLCARAEDFYGGAYFIGGVVEHGRQVGRRYGFPTLNLSAGKEKLLPPDGVYSGLCQTDRGNFPAIVNIGARPTFGVKERKLEAYLDGFSGDLYGTYVRVYPTGFLRPIRKFSSAEALKEQLSQDIQTMRANTKGGYV